MWQHRGAAVGQSIVSFTSLPEGGVQQTPSHCRQGGAGALQSRSRFTEPQQNPLVLIFFFFLKMKRGFSALKFDMAMENLLFLTAATSGPDRSFQKVFGGL